MGILKFFSKGLSRYLWIGLAATTLSTATFAYLYKEALQDVARVRAQAQTEAALAANERAAATIMRMQQAAAEREAQLRRLAERNERISNEAIERAIAAEQRLSNLATEQQNDVTPEFTEWKDQKVPSSVVTRLRSLQE